MSEDEFSKQGGKAFQNVVLGIAGLAGGPASIALTVGASALFNIFEAVAERNTAAFQEGRIAALEDDVLRVRDEVRELQAGRVAAGKPIDAPDPPTQTRIFSDFAEAVADAATPEKRTALVHAAVRQYDPEAGPLAVRKYWFDAVRALPEIDVFAILFVAEHEAVLADRNDAWWTPGKTSGEPSKRLDLPTDVQHAVTAALSRLHKGPYLMGTMSSKIILSAGGRVLVRYMRGE